VAEEVISDLKLHYTQRIERLERRAKTLAWGGNAWHLIEFGIAVAAGIVAGSVALIGFGADSLIEFAAGSVIVWLFTGGRGSSEQRGAARAATDRGELLRARSLHRRRITPRPCRRTPPGNKLGRDRTGCVHRTDDADCSLARSGASGRS